MTQAVRSGTDAGAAAETVDQVTRKLVAWLGTVAPDLPCSSAPEPGDPPSNAPAMRVTLSRIRPGAATANPAAPIELQLDYLCSVMNPASPTVQRALGEIAFAALATGAYGVAEAESGMLGLVLTARLARDRTPERGPPIRERLRPTLRPLDSLSGVLLGPGDIEIANASIWLRGHATGRSVSGPDGRFTLSVDTGAKRDLALTVEINGKQRTAIGVVQGAETVFRVGMEE